MLFQINLLYVYHNYFLLNQKSAFNIKYATPTMQRIFSRCVRCKLSISTFKSRRFNFATCFLKCSISSWDCERFSTEPIPLKCGTSSLKKNKYNYKNMSAQNVSSKTNLWLTTNSCELWCDFLWLFGPLLISSEKCKFFGSKYLTSSNSFSCSSEA